MKEKAVVGRRSSYNSRFNEHFVVNKEFLQRDELCYIALQFHIPFMVNIAKEILEFILDYSCIHTVCISHVIRVYHKLNNNFIITFME